jgi:ubiquinone/menaquinone biosynthesis C-methylase UbiE
MANTQKWWDDFWEKQSFPIASGEDNNETWHDLVWKVCFEYWEDIFKTLAPGKKMLECGCGSARVSQYMAQRGFQCTLLDYSESALSLAKKNFEALSLSGTFVAGDINHLSFSDGQFDVVYSGGVLEFFDDAQKPINEMVRILRPGGIFAANMVPNKFSIQTIADIERTLAYSFKNLVRGKIKDACKRVRMIPPDYKVSSMPLLKYVRICEKAGLTSVVGLATSPFPALALPRVGRKIYAAIMKKFIKQWHAFNESKSTWTEVWGITYTIYGIKK